MAEDSIWATIVSILATYNISKAKDSSGHEIPILGKFTDGLISHPEPFECAITPRSPVARKLIDETVHEEIKE
uniref:Cytochrome P450 n=1 Tax=Mycena chlorophos TaxID=658473 RepID=A0ABQ0MA71_MYCCL|nr:cytochrome P450 [Mycena chlorophos]